MDDGEGGWVGHNLDVQKHLNDNQFQLETDFHSVGGGGCPIKPNSLINSNFGQQQTKSLIKIYKSIGDKYQNNWAAFIVIDDTRTPRINKYQ